jgi:flagellar basal-body rod modification protein FlgD
MSVAATTGTFNALNSASTVTQTKNEAGSADRFLKLLVTQMQNQDPLNPMDNAQITSQMAQINTVNGIEKLNTTVEGLNTQFGQLQALAGASLVGREVTLAGNKLFVEGGQSVAGYELAGTAKDVKIEVLNPAGRVVDTLQLGTQTAGRHDFTWKPAGGVADTAAGQQPHTFRITATQGAATVTSSAYMYDRVEAIRTSGNTLTLDTTFNGSVAYRDVQAVN